MGKIIIVGAWLCLLLQISLTLYGVWVITVSEYGLMYQYIWAGLIAINCISGVQNIRIIFSAQRLS